MGINLRGTNTIKFCGGKESFSHRIAKLALCHLLTKAGHNFKTEQPIGEAVCDVIDLDTLVIYEIESHANSTIIKKKLDDFLHPLIEDLIIVDLRKMDIDWEPVFALRDKIKKFCAL
jgi:hypothetical protein